MSAKKNFFHHRTWWIVALSIVIVFLLIHLVLPLVVRHYANKAINSYPGLAGEIGTVKLNFIPGEYLAQKVRLHYAGKDNREILQVEEIGVRLYWTALLKKTIEGDAWVAQPRLIMWAPKHPKQAPSKKEADWQAQVRSLMPIKINKLKIRKGTILYRDPASKPPVNLKIEDLVLDATNLTNREALKEAMFAKIKVRAKVFSSGHAEIDMQLDPLAKNPTFKLNSAIKNVDLTKLNDFLMAYGKFDVDRGNFSLFMEIAAKKGKFVAYAKPLFRNIDVRTWESKQHPNNKLLILWKNIVGFIVDIFKNEEEDQIATRIKAEGTFDNPDVNIWEAVGSLLRNGFIQALIPGYDNSIRWSDVPKK